MLGFDKPLDFDRGDVRVAGGIQVRFLQYTGQHVVKIAVKNVVQNVVNLF